VTTFHRLVLNTVIASTTNNFLWFALTFWVYLETRSVIASSVIGGTFMLLFAASGIFFGTSVDRNKRKTSMVVSNAASFVSSSWPGSSIWWRPTGRFPRSGNR